MKCGDNTVQKQNSKEKNRINLKPSKHGPLQHLEVGSIVVEE